MKVEFLVDELNGTELVVSASEFLKAKDDDLEFQSLEYATEAFCNLFCISGSISREEYNLVVKYLKRGSAVIFLVKNDNQPSDIWGEFRIYISTNNQNRRIV